MRTDPTDGRRKTFMLLATSFSVMQVFKKQETSDYKGIFIYFLSNHKTQHHGCQLYPSFIVCPFFHSALTNIQHSGDDFSRRAYKAEGLWDHPFPQKTWLAFYLTNLLPEKINR